MSDHLKLGEKGESIAKQHLENMGYQILEQNWRYSRAEVDIIAKDQETLVFVEVKTRSTHVFGDPAIAVHAKKQRMLADAANAYMEQINHDWEIRFDIISIVLSDKKQDVKHYKDAFFPGW